MTANGSDINPDGLSQLFDSEKAEIDIVFVHGLNGHPFDTWKTIDPLDPSETIYWPRDLLPDSVSKVRVLTFGYPTQFVALSSNDSVAHTTIDAKSTSLINILGGYRQQTQSANRPIFFIAHSLGGLVCANALSRRADTHAFNHDILSSVRGLIFLGTPFRGSPKAPFATAIEKILSHFCDTTPKTITDLEKDSENLKQISTNFSTLLRERLESRKEKPIQIACFFETKSTIVKGKTLDIVKKNVGLIVSEESATLPGYKPNPINEDHRTMCKFADNETTGYINIISQLKAMISNLEKDSEHLQVIIPMK
ncbi:unnamed protein product [Penicillium salamii]|uniref:DUF676 domain-containing protein n=1 Tax=Penicillium salamii TaxID=1612424 RepID=A0A9W4NQ37_9EURO|nr:unnamed protein product [Penicillium salamii]